ncbi:hypothetical protein Pfo_012688 [Paulownia fortunei]|nr:hypothetical protein Pfo_012688 [Paulownia fortunei]
MPTRGKGKGKGKQTHRKTTASASNPLSSCIFPREIIFNILSRLPVKTLLRFRCVCKPWRTLISHPRFICEHLNRSPASLIIHAHETQLPIADQPLPRTFTLQPTGHVISVYKAPNPQWNTHSTLVRILGYPGSDALCFNHMDVVGSPNGVVCLVQQPWANKITLWNPATRSSSPVPSPLLPADPNVHRGVSAGIGFDPSCNEYKIIRIMCHELDFVMPDLAEVYSLKSGRWRVVRPTVFFWVLREKCEAVIKGVPYWRAVGNDDFGVRWLLVSFNLQKEVFEVVSVAWVMNKREACIGEIKGCLGMVVWEKEKEKSIDRILDVWMKDDEKGWSKIYRVGPISVVGKVVGFYGDRGIVQVVGNEGNLIMYNLEKMEVEDFINVEDAVPCTFTLVSYRESLIRIPGTGDTI